MQRQFVQVRWPARGLVLTDATAPDPRRRIDVLVVSISRRGEKAGLNFLARIEGFDEPGLIALVRDLQARYGAPVWGGADGPGTLLLRFDLRPDEFDDPSIRMLFSFSQEYSIAWTMASRGILTMRARAGPGGGAELAGRMRAFLAGKMPHAEVEVVEVDNADLSRWDHLRRLAAEFDSPEATRPSWMRIDMVRDGLAPAGPKQ